MIQALEEIIQEVEQQIETGLPFVLYRKPKSNQLNALFSQIKELPIPNYEHSGFILQSFEEDLSLFFDLETSVLKDWEIELKNDLPDYNYTVNTQVDPSYKEGFERIITDINNDRIKKAVLSKIITIPADGLDLSNLLEGLFTHYPKAFCSLFYHPDHQFWIGTTPESLIKMGEQGVEIMSLAGTKRRESANEWRAKEDEEQEVVTRYINQCLQDYGFDNIRNESSNRQAENVVHKLSIIKADGIGDGSRSELVKDLHPTPAVCGIPRKQAFQLIGEIEPHKRGFYAGYLGEVNMSQGKKGEELLDLYVHLRCMQWDGKQARIYVGGGILEGSDLVEEWLETEYKAFAMRRLISLAEKDD